MENKSNIPTRVIALGGLGEVGKNMYLIEHDSEILVIDAGVMFPEDGLLGVDYVIQDVSYLKKNASKIKGLFITHGHEDHIGGIPFLLQAINIPKIYTPKIAKDLIEKKLVEKNIKYENYEIITPELEVKTKYFDITFVNTTHSIPDSYAFLIKTPNGTIFETGDFKFDLTPVGPMADIHKMAQAGASGVTLLLSDSTNALSSGYSKSESAVDSTLNDMIGRHYGRVIIATFASNIYRIKHIVETCKKYNRKIIVFGRSMENSIELALNNGLINDKSLFIEANDAKSLKRNEICILCTGSQGEPLAALSRIANGQHKQISLLGDDLVIFSSNPIPGNAESINKIINKLYLKGVKVFTNSEFSDVHTSGHAKEEELKWMLRIIKPKYFMPMHGEYRMLKRHAEIGIDCGVKQENTFICSNGDVLELLNGTVKKNGTVQAGDVYVDGSRVGDIGSVVIKDRKLMSGDGILITILNINTLTRKLLLKPNVTARGFVLVNENQELMHQIEKKIAEVVNNFLAKGPYTYTDLKNQIILELLPFINNLTGRKPIILPVIMEVNQANN
ncbi:MAG TPA: ribonuclease J [Candidatus Onthocola stercorigallinarum]|nr:ribonuclease J [Candidatus Onthocola stercorigallinarum]